MPPIKFQLNLTYHLGGELFEEFQDGHHGCHLEYWNRTILAILNFHNTLIPPIKFKLNQTYRSRADVI